MKAIMAVPPHHRVFSIAYLFTQAASSTMPFVFLLLRHPALQEFLQRFEECFSAMQP
jgi:hypothetical protein